jgi:hypothetical protein
MAISSVGSAPPAKVPEAREGRGPETKSDHDGDDAGSVKAPVQSSPPPGQGAAVNKKA